METIHHAIMSERWAKEHGCDDEMTKELVFWSMMSDMIPGLLGYHLRGLTHIEDDDSILGSQIHHTTSDLSQVYISPFIPVLSKNSCASRVGIYLHLIQDSAYDEWISKYIGVEKDEEEQWRYHRKDTKAEISSEDVTFLKRWSWRCAWMSEIASELTDAELAGEAFPKYLQDNYIETIKENPRWHPLYEKCLKRLWECEMKQTLLPDSLIDLQDNMTERLEVAWVCWKEIIGNAGLEH